MSRAESATREWWALALLSVIVGITAVVRLRLLDLPLDRDEGEYAYIAQLLLDGVPPYAGAYTMKMPGMPEAKTMVIAAPNTKLRLWSNCTGSNCASFIASRRRCQK